MHTVRIIRNRPDFRCFIDLLYGQNSNVDTDGDASPVNSRQWTYLYLKDRKDGARSVEICARETDLEIFSVESDSSALEELAALYLFLTCGQSIVSLEAHLTASNIELLRKKYSKELCRADQSIWHQSSDAQPYPNFGK